MTSRTTALTFNKLVLLATIAGMRSMMTPLLVSLNLSASDKTKLRENGFDFLAEDPAKKILSTLAFVELLGDKLPFAPSRLKGLMLSSRILSGAAAGAITYELAEKKRSNGAVLGALVALGSSIAFFALRKGLSKSRLVPEPLAGLAEDAAAFFLAGKYLEHFT